MNKQIKEKLATLSPEERQALLTQLKAKEQTKKNTIIKADRGRFSFPLSFAQQRLWFLNEMQPESSFYHILSTFKLIGRLDEEALTKSFQALIKRHEMLRTHFDIASDKKPVQVIAPVGELDFQSIDLMDRAFDERLVEAKKILEARMKKACQLKKGPLWWATLVRVADDEWRLLLTMHHIIFDGWSLGVFITELAHLYESYVKGTKASLPELAFQYVDYVSDQSDKFDDEMRKKQLDYWTQHLSGGDFSPVALPFDYPRPKVQTFAGAVYELILKKELFEGLKQVSRECNATMFMTLLAAFKVLLYRYSASTDIIVGTPISGRNQREFEHLIGPFINTLPLRTNLANNPTFTELLEQVRAVSLDAYANQDVSFDAIVDEMNPERSLSYNPIFQLLFAYQNALQPIKTADLAITYETSDDQTAKFDLSLEIFEGLEGPTCLFEYNTDLFKKETVEKIAHSFQKLLIDITGNPTMKLNEIEMITNEERTLIIEQINNTCVPYPREKTVVELFEEQVRKTPNQVAVVCEDQHLTYQELNEKSNQLAHVLRNKGVGKESFVGILSERNIETVIGIYGIIKAGAAYVPIDPSNPLERTQYMIDDCRLQLILTSQTAIHTEIEVLNLCDSNLYEGLPTEDLSLVNEPADLIYVIYTSGTTGKPKGVMVEHRSVIRLTKNQNYVNLNEETVVLQTGAMSFDASTFELWGTALNGGRVVLLPEETLLNVAVLKETIIKNKVNTMFVTTALYNQLISSDASIFDSLEQLLFGGEKTSVAHVKLLMDRNLALNFSNIYGPTENTTFSLYYPITNKIVKDKIPIGRPINNTQVYIMNEDTLCGIGIPGELCLAGDGLARGYLNQPELTAKKFINNPHGEGLLYRSGDLARWLEDGNIEYLGRIDDQVKIRGFRIELGEIESVLRGHPDIKDCAVIAKADKTGEQALYGYVASDEAVEIDALRESLLKALPAYMVPPYLLQIDALPLTTNGKLDKRALPEIEAQEKAVYVAPRNKEEELLSDIFKAVLGVERASIKESFFALGGHSLRAIRLINQIESEVGIRLEVKDVFTHPTIEALSHLITEKSEGEYIPIPIAKEQASYEMSSSQKRVYLIQQMDPESVAYHMPHGLRLSGEIDVQRFKRSLEEMVKRHTILRTAFVMEAGELSQRILDDIEVGFAYEIDEQTSVEALMEAFIKPFDLAKGELVRMKLIKRVNEHLLLIDVHHIISDGMSMVTFIKEFSDLYNGKALEALTHQYKDYSEWMKIRDLSNQKAYWKELYADEIPILDMPLDYPRPKEQSFRGSMEVGHIKKVEGEQIRKLAQETGSTTYMVFLSAAMVLLGRYSRQEDIVIGSPVSGRTHRDTEGMLGMFVNTLAMRGKAEKEKRFDELLQEIKASSLQAYDHQEYPYEELIEEIGVVRDMSRNPLFDVMLVMQNNEQVTYELSGIKTERIQGSHDISKFDMTFNIEEEAEGYGIYLEYCCDLYQASSIKRLLTVYIDILKQVSENKSILIKEITLINEADENKILNVFNNTAVAYPREKTVVELFEEQVKKTPNQVAVVYEDAQLTYRELNEKSNQLAHLLRSKGVGKESLVGILSERSIYMIIGIYGIIKAGGAYVPIDPDYPLERVQYMIDDCKLRLILTAQTTAIHTEVETINLCDFKLYEGMPTEDLLPVNEATDLIYVIYTSGTTGKPKGVMIEHRNVIRLTKNQNYVCLNEETVILQTGAMSFDASTFELWGTALNGGKLILSDRGVITDHEQLKRVMKQCAVNTIWLTSTLFNQLIQTNATLFDELKYVLIGGEKLSDDHVSILNDRANKVTIINGYGPTESTTFTTTYKIPKHFKRILIGRPINNTQVYIMNEGQLCGIGVPGELCIAGDGLARGYLNRPELTAKKFINNPYKEGLLYRSGDLARWLEDGNIEYLGRMDNQVKIRGFRIELAEIEHALLKIPKINQAHVSVLKKEEDHYLGAYYTSDEEIAHEVLEQALGNELPTYMMPTGYQHLNEFPLTINGKLDHRKLPAISFDTGVAYLEPVTLIEKIVAKSYEAVLNVSSVGCESDFFRLGGHSLYALKLVNLLEAKTGKAVQIKHIFEAPKVSTLASLLEQLTTAEYERLPKAPKQDVYEMSSIQKRMYLLWKLTPTETAYNMPTLFRFEKSLNEVKIKAAFKKLVERHEILRTTFHRQDSELVQIISEAMPVDILVEQEREERLATWYQASVCPFDLEEGPLYLIKIVRTPQHDYLFVDMHHIISDGMSVTILVKEFNQLIDGEKLMPLDRQYKDYSEWMKHQNLNASKNYWVESLVNYPILDLATDYRRPKQQQFFGATEELVFGSRETAQIKKLIQSNGATAYMFFLALISVLLAKLTNQDEMVIGAPMSGRIHKDTESMLGMFTNTLALSVNPSGDKSFSAYLEELRIKTLKAQEHQMYPLDDLVEQVVVHRDLSRHPLFDIVIVYQNNEETMPLLGSGKWHQFDEFNEGTAKFDLCFILSDDGRQTNLSLNYATSLFKGETIQLYLKRLMKLLEQVLTDENQLIQAYDILLEEEKMQLLAGFGQMPLND